MFWLLTLTSQFCLANIHFSSNFFACVWQILHIFPSLVICNGSSAMIICNGWFKHLLWMVFICNRWFFFQSLSPMITTYIPPKKKHTFLYECLVYSFQPKRKKKSIKNCFLGLSWLEVLCRKSTWLYGENELLAKLHCWMLPSCFSTIMFFF